MREHRRNGKLTPKVKTAVRKLMLPNASSPVIALTAEFQRLAQEIRDATFAKDDASFAVSLLSDDWVLSDSAAVYAELGLNSPMLRVCRGPSFERQKKSKNNKIFFL